MKKSVRNLISSILKVVILLFGLDVGAQEINNCDYQIPGEAANWIFGERAYIQFNNGEAQPAYLGTNLNLPNGVASISDKQGNLLFFSDGMSIWKNDLFLLQGTNNLDGNNFATQSALFVPQPGRDDKYYLFTVDMYIPPDFSDGVRYTTIERINGSWTVTLKNQLLIGTNAQKLTAVRTADERAFWVITHGYGTQTGNTFYAYRIDDQGLASTAITSTAGTINQTHAGNPSSANNNTGYMRASSDGNKIALTIPDDGIVEVFDFNPTNGQISNARSSGPATFEYPFGLEFSPDNTKLYVTTSPPGAASTNRIYQLDLQQADFFSNPTIVEELTGNQTDDLFGALQLGIDGRIYVASYRRGVLGKPFIGVIYNPDRPGSECNYNHLGQDNNGLNLNGGQGLIGLPNFVSSFLDIPHFRWTNHCHTHITAFNLRNDANIEEINWDFGDGSASSDQLQGMHTFSSPGDYTITITESYNNQQYITARDLTIYPLPIVDIGQGGDTLFILPNSSITLDAGEYDTYLWEPDGSVERYLDVDEEGLYIVTVTDTNCCVNSDTVYVAFSNIYLPTAFRPQSSHEENTNFKLMGAISALENFTFYIFNRWGELVFETTDPGIGWDGRLMNGQQAPQGVYAWALYYESKESRYQARQQINQRGVVTLMR